MQFSLKKVLLRWIRFYQRRISPNTPPRCRFYPTCSAYTYTAIEQYGAMRGSLMGLWRILRCNPWNPGGYDPVPVKRITIDATPVQPEDTEGRKEERQK